MEFALGSGYYAARAVLKAREAGDFGAETLSVPIEQIFRSRTEPLVGGGRLEVERYGGS